MEWGSGSVESNSILELIEKYIEENEELCKEFAEPIDLNYYSNYFDVVPLEMPLSKIKTRIRNNYYRRIESLLADFDQLLFNAELYITKENVYYEYAEQIVKELKNQILKTEKQVQVNFDIELQKVFEDIQPVQLQEEIQKELEDFEILIDESLPIKDRRIIWMIHNKQKYCFLKPICLKRKTEIPPQINEIAQPPRALRSFKSSTIVSQEEMPEITKSDKSRKYRLRERGKKCNYAE